MTQDLLLAILAMDSYNRRYNQGLNLDDVGRIGTATVSYDSRILGLDSGSNLLDQQASFFAQSYILDGGQKVIAYRGTDSGWDALYGWPLATGNNTVAQASLAARRPIGLPRGDTCHARGSSRPAIAFFCPRSLRTEAAAEARR